MKETKDKNNIKTVPSDFLSENFCQNKRNRILLLFAIFALAFSLRLARAMQLEIIGKDGAYFVLLAENIRENGFSEAFVELPEFPPLYILLIALGAEINLPLESAASLISIISSALLVFPIYFIAKNIFSKTSHAFLSAIFVAVYPNLARIGAQVLRDPLYQLLSISALCLIIEGIGKNKKYFYILAGALSALSAATRREGIELAFALALFLAIETVFQMKARQKIPGVLLKNILIFTIFTASFLFTALSFEYAMKGSKSQWTVFDRRVPALLKTFFDNLDQ